MKNKTIFRVSRDKGNPYVMVNKEWINDNKLSAKSKGILLYLLSKPDNWQVYETDIIKHMNDGRSSIRSGIKELLDEGYIHRKQKRNEDGKFGGYAYTVYEHRVRFSDNGNSDNRKPYTTNNNLTNNNLTNIKYKGESSDSQYVEDDFSFTILSKQIDSVLAKEDIFTGNLSISDIKYFFNMFYSIGKRIRNIEPYRLKNEQIKNIIKSIGCIGDEVFEPTIEDYELIIENYFNQDFEDCDYGINHFVSGDVLLMRCYNLQANLSWTRS